MKITEKEFFQESDKIKTHNVDNCPNCGEEGRIAIMQRIESGFLMPKKFAGLYCRKCNYAQSKPQDDIWYSITGELHFPIGT